jgi:hypothetical protein
MTLVHNAGFPHSEIPGSQPAHGSPRLIAVFHVLHRHLAPRHPPYALSSLTQRDAEKLTFFHLLLSAIRLLRCSCLRGSCPAGGLTAQVVLPVSWGDHLVDQTFHLTHCGPAHRRADRDQSRSCSKFVIQFGRRLPVPNLSLSVLRSGGDDGTRTRDICLAKAALSQLSYIPMGLACLRSVGLSGFEPETFPLSEERSNQLS